MNCFRSIRLSASILCAGILVSVAQDTAPVAPAEAAPAVKAVATAPAVKLWEGNVGFSAVLNSGNNVNQTVGGNGLLSRKFDNNKVTLTGNGAYGRAELAGKTQTNTKNWLSNLRYDRFLTQTVTGFGYGFWGQNVPAGFDDRFGGGAGIGHDFYKTEEDAFRYEVGYDFTRERRVNAFDASIHSARTFLKYTRKVAAWASFVQDVEALWNLQQGEDIRVNTLSSLTTKLTNMIAFQIGVGIRFDNQPVAGFKKTDTQTQAGLVVNFL